MEKYKPQVKEIQSELNVLEPIGVELLRTLRDETTMRVEIDSYLRSLFARTKENEVLPESEANLVYKELSDFINTDPTNNSRIVLYLPLQLLPDLNINKSKAAGDFADTLRNSWIRLLFESEVRANFVDGDELEPGFGVPPRTRKAAHLLPQFLERGIISETDVINLLEISSEEELTRALIEGIIVANDKNLFSQKSWEEIQSIAKVKKLTMDRIIQEGRYSSNPTYKNISLKRREWEKGVKIDEVIETASQQTALKLVNLEITTDEIEESGVVEIRAIVRAGEIFAKEDPKKAQIFIEKSLPLFRKFWFQGTSAEKEEVRLGASHLERLNVLPKDFLTEFGIDVPDLSKSIPIDINLFIENEGKPIIKAAKKIKEDPELSKYLYPVFLVFGSRIKGYADEDGDFDIAILVRPGVSWEKHDEIVSLLRTSVPEVKNIDRILEFWVNEKGGELGLNVAPENATTDTLGPQQIHFLFGSVWIGQDKDVQKLREDLTNKYLDLTRYGNEKELVRTKLLRQLELDVLQYRLMHKGYKKYYPSKKEVPTKHGNLIDANSDFWDQGYRRVATLLFLTRVFLPDLS